MVANILVVDDDPSVRTLLSSFLKLLGYDFQLAEDGQAALDSIRKNRPDLVLLDIAMPKMGGLEFLKASKSIYPELPVIMITARVDDELAKTAMEGGAADYITKPIGLEYLATTIKAMLAITMDSRAADWKGP